MNVTSSDTLTWLLWMLSPLAMDTGCGECDAPFVPLMSSLSLCISLPLCCGAASTDIILRKNHMSSIKTNIEKWYGCVFNVVSIEINVPFYSTAILLPVSMWIYLATFRSLKENREKIEISIGIKTNNRHTLSGIWKNYLQVYLRRKYNISKYWTRKFKLSWINNVHLKLFQMLFDDTIHSTCTMVQIRGFLLHSNHIINWIHY